MSTMTLTLYEAIGKKKTYEDKLKKFDISQKTFFGKYTEGNKIINGVELEEAGKVMKSNFDSYIHTQKNITALQRAINKANLENMITISGYNNNEPVTIVEAITEKQRLADRKVKLNAIISQLTRVQNEIEKENKRVLDPEYMYTQIARQQVSDKKSEKTDDVYASLVDKYRLDNTMKLYDPNKIVEKEWIESQTKEIESFETNLHSALMTANTKITLEVELED